MALSIYPITPDFVAEVGDVDLSQGWSAQDESAIQQAFWKYAVLIFPQQQLRESDHLRFAEIFGPLETTIGSFRDDAQLRTSDKIADVSNLNTRSEIWDVDSRQRMFQLGNRLWHTDSSFRHLPGRASLLHGRSIAPIGGHTEFADLRAAFDALPETERAVLRPLIAEHSIFHSRAKLGFSNFSQAERAALPPVRQALVRQLPENGRETLYLASHMGGIEGLSSADGEALIQRLIDHSVQRQFVYTHRWRENDLVMWDNRCTMHRGTDFDDLRWRRDFRRATVHEAFNSVDLMAVR